jgi:hypothetical protein
MIENSFGSIVHVAQVFNPSIFTEKWLLENNLLKDDMVGIRIFSPEMAQFQTQDMQILVTIPRFLVSYPLKNETESGKARNFINQIIDLLPHTPFRSLGINFDYFVSQPSNQTFGDFNRALFGSGNNRMLPDFDSADSRFGAYLSKNYEKARLRLDIKPVTILEEDRELIQFSFNFHHELMLETEAGLVSQLKGMLSSWHSLLSYSTQLVTITTA